MEAATHEPTPTQARTGLLVLRVWLEPDTREPLRARLLSGDDGSAGAARTTLGVAAGTDQVCALVREWLESLHQGR